MSEKYSEPVEEVSDRIYLINYDEDLWNAYDKPGQEATIGRWLRKAAQQGCKRVVLRLHPDDLFPSGVHDKPYVARQEDVELERRLAVYQCETSAHINLNAWEAANANDKALIRATVKAELMRRTPIHGMYSLYVGSELVEVGQR